MKHKKYTLIELLISMGIFAVMMLLLLNFFSKYQDFTYRAGLRNERNADVQTFFSQIERDLKGIYGLNQDTGGLSPGANLTAPNLIFYSRAKYNDVNNSGIGGLARIKYGFASEKITRVAESANSTLKSALDVGTGPSGGDDILTGVSSCTFQGFSSKLKFRGDSLNAPNADAAGVATSLYAVLITVTVQDTNTNMNSTERAKNALTFSKLVIINAEETP
jgi:type II secretory pathway pseudopilin PulG